MASKSRRERFALPATAEVPIVGRPQVKTLTFSTLAGVLPQRFEAPHLAKIRGALTGPTREILDAGQPGSWVDEAHMQELLEVIYEVGLDREDEAFNEFCRTVALEGIGRFMKIFLTLASDRFVLRRIPVVWGRLRRCAGTVTAESGPGYVRLHYAGFPFFNSHLYRILSTANCQALVQAATGRVPVAQIKSWTGTMLCIEFDVRSGAAR